MSKVALAYSGSLDTTICLYWLRAKGMRVFTFSANVGQPENLEPLSERALALGAVSAHIADLRDRFAWDFIIPCLRAGAVYERGYHLLSALTRPLIVQELVDLAQEEGCTSIAHGSRGIGNDAIRFRNCTRALAPDLQIIAPLQEIGLASPEEDLRFAREHKLPVESVRETLFNIEQNLWGANIQFRAADPWAAPPRETYRLTLPPETCPDTPALVTIGFERGIPVSLDEKPHAPVPLIQNLNRLGGNHGVGRFDLIENRITGRKTRELYETPAAEILMNAHRALESVILDRALLHFQEIVRLRYADLVYEGHWFTTLREALDAFFGRTQENITGTVQCRLLRGRVDVIRVNSPYSQIVSRDTTMFPLPNLPSSLYRA
jgi:argininosuccinate synthase